MFCWRWILDLGGIVTFAFVLFKIGLGETGLWSMLFGKGLFLLNIEDDCGIPLWGIILWGVFEVAGFNCICLEMVVWEALLDIILLFKAIWEAKGLTFTAALFYIYLCWGINFKGDGITCL